MFKYRLKLNLIFGFLFLGLIFTPQINYYLFYFSFFLFSALGTGLGYHRILGHGLIVPTPLKWFSISLGALAHLGAPKGAAMWHINHHQNTDTEFDQKKTWLSMFTPRVEKLKVSRSNLKQVFYEFDKDIFLRLLDNHFYLFMLPAYMVILLFFGVQNTFTYFIAPASLSLFVHSASAIVLHGQSKGYRNFNTADKSINSFLFLPLMFGENWHNNHHEIKDSMNNRVRWWEFDLVYLISRPFNKSDFRW